MLAIEQECAGQEWPFELGERTVRFHLELPPAGITPNTGLMLVLHNWGGRYNEAHYIEWARVFAARYNVVAISVNYLQSGGGEPTVNGEIPYDFSYLQAMDCLRALRQVWGQLRGSGAAFNDRRCYAMGVSGGGHVTQVINKFAPYTFACSMDICGMTALNDSCAFGLGEYGSALNAGYSPDPASPAFPTPDMREIRDIGHPGHLAIQFKANPGKKMIIVHGLDDLSCAAPDKIAAYRNMVIAGLRPDAHFITKWLVDGEAVTCTDHPVGNRCRVFQRFADDYALEEGRLALALPGPNDFERGGPVVLPTTNGRFVIDYGADTPTIRFERGQ